MSRSRLGNSCRLNHVVGTVILFGLFAAFADGEEITRKWRDASGKFEVEAKLVEQDEKQVKLLKADGLIVSVPISALSKEDQTFLEQHKKDANPFAGGVPATNSVIKPSPGTTPDKPSVPAPTDESKLSRQFKPTELPVGGEPIFLGSNEPVPPLEADVAVAIPKLKNFVQPLAKLDAYAKLSDPVFIDPSEGVFALSAHRVGNAVAAETFGRVFVYRPDQKKPTTAFEIDQTFKIFAHHAPSGRTLAAIGLDSGTERGGDLVLLEGLASGKPVAVGRWHLPEWQKGGFAPKIEFARMLDAARALVQVNNDVYVWDLDKQTLVHRIERLRAGAKIECSANGKYLAIPAGGLCQMVDLTRGELLGVYKFTSVLTPEVKFSPDGSKLALVGGNQIVVWEITTGERKYEITIGDPCGQFYGWMNDRQLLTQLGGLTDLDLGLSVWKYYLGAIRHVVPVTDGIVVADSSIEYFVGCLGIPHTSVRENAQRLQIDDDKKFVLKPGSKVALETMVIEGVDEAEMKSGLKTAVERAGWVVDPSSNIKVSAAISRGEKQTLYFRTIGRSILQPGEKVSIRPFTASITIRDDAKTLWERNSTNMVPSFLMMKANQTLQQAVKEYERADPGYFERLTIPPKIMAPEFAKTIRTSTIKAGEWIEQ